MRKPSRRKAHVPSLRVEVMRRWWVATWLVLALLGAGCAQPAKSTVGHDPNALAAGKGAIAGLLIDDVYRPIAGGLVFVEAAGLTATTDAEGQFTFSDLGPGSYTLIANAAGHEAAPLAVDVRAGAYADAEIEARRLFSANGTVLTTQTMEFVPCQAATPIGPLSADCIADLSGDASPSGGLMFRGTGDEAFVVEAKTSQPADYQLRVWCNDDGAGASTRGTGDPLRLAWRHGNGTAAEANANSTRPGVHLWPRDCKDLSVFMDYEGLDPAGLGAMGFGGVGAQVGVKETFLLTEFLGDVPDNLADYHIFGPSHSAVAEPASGLRGS